MIETWLPVVGFEGLYEVSDHGRVRSMDRRRRTGAGFRTVRGRLLAPSVHVRGGYLYVTLNRPGRKFHRKVHYLVCSAFNGPRPADLPHCRHLDGDHLNNVPGNLAWGTPSQNLYDTVAHGRHHGASRDHCIRDHPLFGPNLYVNPASGARQCRICQRAANARYQARKKASARV